MTTATPPAGWYDDPEHGDQLRWWDGVAWTDYRRAAGTSVPAEQCAAVAQSTASVAEPQPRAQTAPASTAELASAGDRLLAFLLDLVFGVVLFLAATILGAIGSVLPDALAGLFGFVVIVGVYAVLFISEVMGVGRLGQSYGKHLMGLRVISTHDGTSVGSPAAFGRNLIRMIGMYVFFLGVLWILWDPQRQGWHDKVVSSIVVTDPSPTKLDPVAYLRAIFDA
ncbi:MAG: RDD family protein [Actinobacteria bacterium]|nr:RDD family protein [Actinomycetota bacterium]